jgi:hypothetical protein
METVRGHPVFAQQCLSTYCGPHIGSLRKLKREVMIHPVHSPDVAPSDFHFFGSLKKALGGRRF